MLTLANSRLRLIVSLAARYILSHAVATDSILGISWTQSPTPHLDGVMGETYVSTLCGSRLSHSLLQYGVCGHQSLTSTANTSPRVQETQHLTSRVHRNTAGVSIRYHITCTLDPYPLGGFSYFNFPSQQKTHSSTGTDLFVRIFGLKLENRSTFGGHSGSRVSTYRSYARVPSINVFLTELSSKVMLWNHRL